MPNASHAIRIIRSFIHSFLPHGCREEYRTLLYLARFEALGMAQTAAGLRACNKPGMIRGLWRGHGTNPDALGLILDLCQVRAVLVLVLARQGIVWGGLPHIRGGRWSQEYGVADPELAIQVMEAMYRLHMHARLAAELPHASAYGT
jgi:hypothetical protein